MQSRITDQAGRHAPPESRLPLYLALAYSALAIYGSLYPWTDWRDSGAALGDFLLAPWPRYYTGFDLTVNVAAYAPLGFLWVAALRARLGVALAIALAVLLASALSLALEVLQHYLPTRVPSNIDLACNAAGALIGALAAVRWSAALLDGGRLHALRQQVFMHGRAGDAGLLLLGLWLLTQLNPMILLFGNGDLRSLLGLPAPLSYSAGRFADIEAVTVCAHTLAIGLVAGRLARVTPLRTAFTLIVAGLLTKTLALALLMQGAEGLAWATPGSVVGVAAGLLLWIAASRAPTFLRQAIAALALLFATVLVNLVPDNPYLIDTQKFWGAGQLLNLHGLTRIVSSLWPFLALPWLFLLRSRHD